MVRGKAPMKGNMQMKKKITAVSLILILAMLASSLIVTIGASAETATGALDFSDVADSYNITVSPSGFLSLLLPEITLSDAEAEYINTYSECALIYNDAVSNENISTFYDSGTLYITASEYSYKTSDNVTVTWYPETATVAGNTVLLTESEGKYSCSLPMSDADSSPRVTVKYSCSLTVPAEYANLLLNYAYNDAATAIELSREYEESLSGYLEAFRSYEEYLKALNEYNFDCIKYEEYLSLKAQYDADYAAYTEYLTQLAEYNIALAKYNEYLAAMEQYNADKAAYEKAYAENGDAIKKYIAYLEAMSAVNNSLYVIDNIYAKPLSSRGSLFKALQNRELVSQFEQNKDSLVKYYGVSSADIDSLTVTSNELNIILNEYDEIRNESRQAAFEYYKSHYNEIKDKFNYLYDKMSSILTPTIFNHICGKIDITYDAETAEYKKWRIRNVLSHIYLVCKCLDDSETAAGSWTFYDNSGKTNVYYFTELLDANEILNDNNASSPLALTWPAEVEKTELPKIPVEPVRVNEPLAPQIVAKPDEPERVEKPPEPSEVENPGDPPANVSLIVQTSEIVNEVNSGTLTERPPISDDITLTFYTEVSKLVSAENLPILSICDYDGKTVLYETVLRSESDFILPSDIPERPSDAMYNYSFSSWSSARLEEITPAYTADTDISLYAYYSRSDRYYTVEWFTDGLSTAELYKYGEIPEFKGDTSKSPGTDTVYTFSGWYPAPAPVKADTSYTAVYNESVRLYRITFDIRGNRITQNYRYGETPSVPPFASSVTDNCTKYVFSGWDKEIVAVNSDTVYTALWDEIPLAEADGTLSLIPVSGGYSLVSDASVIDIAELVKLCADTAKRLEITYGGMCVTFDRTAVSEMYSGGARKISFEINGGEKPEYRFTVFSEAGTELKFLSGEIRMKIACPDSAPASNLCITGIFPGSAKQSVIWSYQSGNITFIASNGIKYVFDKKYNVTVVSSENGAVFMDSSLLYEGEKLTVFFYPDPDYTIDDIKITLSDGSELHFSSLDSFTMPASDITLTVAFRQNEYTVSFVVNGQIISTGKYYLGDTVELPEIEITYESGDYIYTFAGWSPYVGAVTGDTVYTAKFNCRLTGVTGDQGDTNAWRTIIRQFALPAVSALMLICIIVLAVILPFKLRKRRQ